MSDTITPDARGDPTVRCATCGERPRVRMVRLPLGWLCVSFHLRDGKRCDGTKRHTPADLRDYLPVRGR